MTDFATSVDRLLNQVRHWEAPRWRAEGRGDRVYALVQRLADLAADAEGRPRRVVPRESDLVLPDQLRVIADDVPAGALQEALAEVDAVRQSL
ncbi:hypothetical protein [Paractinoplanes atraurantiacus]|uniref:Uncharacterized protein n=1 Tax=Paractinoplanes atraurantiacus TaxID=1036182 RepID=A0A285GXS1_9ACTN|nr:hypothetical protein [Actinoplanes atraurantiacus]SNY28093.1 hypothetical protein SAMN05421748_10323 [Actinoplanes atraurantiacus]